MCCIHTKLVVQVIDKQKGTDGALDSGIRVLSANRLPSWPHVGWYANTNAVHQSNRVSAAVLLPFIRSLASTS